MSLILIDYIIERMGFTMVWEYLVLYFEHDVARAAIEAELDRYGLNRWELISVVFNSVESRREYYFKRESLVEIA